MDCDHWCILIILISHTRSWHVYLGGHSLSPHHLAVIAFIAPAGHSLSASHRPSPVRGGPVSRQVRAGRLSVGGSQHGHAVGAAQGLAGRRGDVSLHGRRRCRGAATSTLMYTCAVAKDVLTNTPNITSHHMPRASRQVMGVTKGPPVQLQTVTSDSDAVLWRGCV